MSTMSQQAVHSNKYPSYFVEQLLAPLYQATEGDSSSHYPMFIFKKRSNQHWTLRKSDPDVKTQFQDCNYASDFGIGDTSAHM